MSKKPEVKVAVITGGNSGIGLAPARRFVDGGVSQVSWRERGGVTPPLNPTASPDPRAGLAPEGGRACPSYGHHASWSPHQGHRGPPGPIACARRSDRPKRRTDALRASVSSDRRAQRGSRSRCQGEDLNREEILFVSSEVRFLRRRGSPALSMKAAPCRAEWPRIRADWGHTAGWGPSDHRRGWGITTNRMGLAWMPREGKTANKSALHA
jgi:hypothetical protein